MSNRDDGGPAFPETGSRGMAASGEGMSLRDWFAGRYHGDEVVFNTNSEVEEFMGEPVPPRSDQAGYLTYFARVRGRLAYMHADAMLAERDR